MESIARQTSFAIRLSKHVGAEVASDCNFVFSPLSVHLVLALVAAGSKDRTLDEILSFLGLSSGELVDLNSLSSQIVSLVLADGSASGGPRVSFANGVFVDSSLTLKPSFNDIVANTFKAEVKAVDFLTKVPEEVGNKERVAVLQNLDLPPEYDVVSVDPDEEDSDAICSLSEGEASTEQYCNTVTNLLPTDSLFVLLGMETGWQVQVEIPDQMAECQHLCQHL